MRTTTITVNARTFTAEIDERTSLADFIREHCRYTATHLGCEHGVCGACTVVVDGAPARSCIALAVACDGMTVSTVEGFADDPVMATIKRAFHEQHGLQCGFCTPGMLITARDIVTRRGRLSDQQIRVELSGNLCRCTGYDGIVRAVRQAAADLDQTGEPA